MIRALLLSLPLLAACTDKAEGESAPTLSFLAPEAGGTVTAGTVSVTVIVENFALEEPESALNRPIGAALLPWILPGRDAAAHNDGTAEGYCELTLDDVIVADLYETQHDLDAVDTGEHTLSGELFFSDGDALDPPVTASITFTAE